MSNLPTILTVVLLLVSDVRIAFVSVLKVKIKKSPRFIINFYGGVKYLADEKVLPATLFYNPHWLGCNVCDSGTLTY